MLLQNVKYYFYLQVHVRVRKSNEYFIIKNNRYDNKKLNIYNLFLINSPSYKFVKHKQKQFIYYNEAL